MQPSRIARAVALVLAPLAVAAPALAADSILLEEVVVSAQKREQNIQDVGISIAAFTGDQLDAMGIQSSYDVATFTPGVHISGALAGQNSQFTIRGVTQRTSTTWSRRRTRCTSTKATSPSPTRRPSACSTSSASKC